MFDSQSDKVHLDRCIRHGERRGEIVLDTENFLELFLAGIGAVGAAFLVLSGVWLLFDAFSSTPIVEAGDVGPFTFLIAGAILLVVGAFLRSKVDFYYILDPEEKTLQSYRRYLDYESRKQICTFEDIKGLGIDSKVVKTTERLHDGSYKKFNDWMYGMVVVLRSGKQIRVLDRLCKDFEAIRSRGEEVAQSTGLQLYGEQRKRLRVKRGTGDCGISFHPQNSFDIFFENWKWAILALLVLWTGFRLSMFF